MRNPVLSLVLGLVLLATVVVPPVVYMALGTSSEAAGVLVVSGLYVFVFVAITALSPSVGLGYCALFVAVVVGVVFTQGVLSLSINNEFDFGRFWQASLLLTIVLLGALSLARLAQKLSNAQVDFKLKFVVYALFLTGLAGIAGGTPFSRETFEKPVLVFAEPSHFALSFLPFLFYMVVTSNAKLKVLFLFTSLLIALFLKSLTLIIGIAIILLIAVPLRRLLFMLSVGALILVSGDLELVTTVVDVDYFAERADLTRENQNLSVMAFMQGWERAYLNLGDSNGLGVGFQQFGIVGSRGEIFEDLANLTGEELNLLDGSSVASKFIAEFGILGAVTLLAYLIFFAKNARWLQEVSGSGIAPRDCRQIFFTACFVMYFIDLFVRGAGYFSSTGFLFIASALWMAFGEQPGLSTKMTKVFGSVH